MSETTRPRFAVVLSLALLGASCIVRAQEPDREPAEDDEIPASFISTLLAQQPAARGPSLSAPANSPASRQPRSSLNNRLASAPELFGDYFQSGGDLNFGPPDASGSIGDAGSFSVPAAGGGRVQKISENNRAMPTDRFYFTYNHFHNALQFSERAFFGGPTITQDYPIDRYTGGFEKTFFDGMWSCEIRLPMQGDFNFQGVSTSGNGGNVGNLAVVVKALLYIDQELSVVAGLGLDTPTGSNFTVTDTTPGVPISQIIFRNDAFHILPYIGLLWAGDQPYFINAFLQVDAATGGNRIDTRDLGGPTTTLGLYNQQNLLFVDLGTGYWLYQDPLNDGLTNLAAILEFHYTTSLQDTDAVGGFAGSRQVNFTNNLNRFDVLNVTAGMQAQFYNLTSVRVACVVPVGQRDDQRFFDAEIQVQINRRF